MNSRVALVAVLLVICLVVLRGNGFAQKQSVSRPEVVYDSYHDTSLPPGEYSMAAPQGPAPREVERPRISGRG